MKVKNILPEYPLDEITVRTFGPDGEDMLFGYCGWNGDELISIDGDNYCLDDEISKYEYDDSGNLTYWIVCKWE